MPPSSSYRHLLDLAGPWFVLVAFAARLPLAMSQLGTLLLVAGSTGSYAAGGLSAGAVAVANAVGAPLAGALSDRIGQRPVLLAQSTLSALGLLGLVLTAGAGQRLPVLVAAAVLAGAFLPQAGTLARVRWRLLAGRAARPRLAETAFSLEGALDEASFVLGPALVGLGAAVLSPTGALLASAALVLVAGLAFALHPTAELTRPDRSLPTAVGGRLLSGRLVLLLVSMLAVGSVFGSVQTGSSVLATAAGEPGLTGGLHALLGVGSVVAGLLVPALPTSWTLSVRLVAFATALLVLSTPLLVVDSLTSLVPVLALLGFSIAPTMITVFSLTARVAPSHRITTALTVLAATIGLGYALGSTVAGRLADQGGHTPAYAVTVAAAGLVCVTAVVLALTARADRGGHPDPGSAVPASVHSDTSAP